MNVESHNCCYPKQVKLYTQMTSQQKVASSEFQKTQIFDQSFYCNKKKNEPVHFSGQYEAATTSFLRGKILHLL